MPGRLPQYIKADQQSRPCGHTGQQTRGQQLLDMGGRGGAERPAKNTAPALNSTARRPKRSLPHPPKSAPTAQPQNSIDVTSPVATVPSWNASAGRPARC